MDILKWLLPGIRVKRWVLLTTIGIVVFAQGLTYINVLINADYNNELVNSNIIFGKAVSLAIVGAIVIIISLRALIRSIIKAYVNDDVTRRQGKVIDVLVRQNILKYAPRIVAIGGGTGLAMLLNGLKEITTNITAVVTVADNGGSSGRLRAMDIPAPGDIRNCILALATAGDQMYDLFNYRYSSSSNVPAGLEGHSFGNLFIATLTRITGDFPSAVRLACQVLAVQGKVLPVTDCNNVHLQAELIDGRKIIGESEIGNTPTRIKKLSLTTECSITEEVKSVINDADLIVIGPGSIYTSIIATLLPEGMKEALASTSGNIVYISNIMTQASESLNYTVSDHINAIENHLGKGIIDAILVNTTEVDQLTQVRYHAEGAEVAKIDKDNLEDSSTQVIYADLLDYNENNSVRHAPEKIAWELAKYMFSTTKTDSKNDRKK